MNDTNAWHDAVRRALAVQLSSLFGAWVDERGELRGPGSLSVQVEQRHQGGRRHVDVGFVLNRNRADAPAFWDCIAAPQHDVDEAAAHVANIWVGSTAPAVLELLTRKGQFADHAQGADGLGISGWHSIHGPILAYGSHGMEALQRWLVANPPMPLLERHLKSALTPDGPHSVKLILVANAASSTCEIRVDGEPHPAASAALSAMSWPREGARAVLRQFTIFAHPHGPAK